MSKFHAPVPVSGKKDEKITGSGKCDACGWDFSQKHMQMIIKADGSKKERLVVRDEICRPIMEGKKIVAVVTRCGTCFERESYVMKRSRYAGTDIEHVHKQSIREDESAEYRIVP